MVDENLEGYPSNSDDLLLEWYPNQTGYFVGYYINMVNMLPSYIQLTKMALLVQGI